MKNIFVKLSLVLMLITMSVGQVWADVTFSEGDILYVKVSAVDWWNNGGCKHYAALRSSSEGNVTWTSSAAECVNATDGIWAYKMPAGTFKYVLIVRGSKIGAWGYNNTGEIVLQTDKNYISKFEQSSATVTWGTYQLTSTASSSPSATTISEREFVTFGSALTSNQTYNVVKSTGYSVSPGTSGTDWTIDNANNKVTFLKAGTYTVTSSVTYNAKGFTNITKSADVQNTITVNAAAPVVTNYYIAGEGAIFGSWAAKGVQLEGPVDAVYSKTFSGRTGTTYKFKITTGTWDQTYNTYDQSKSANVTLSHVDKDNNVSFEIAADGNFTIYFDPNATKHIWVVGPTPAATYTVTYAAGEGSGSMTDSNSPYEAGTEVTLLDNTFTAPTGKVFEGWQVKDASNNDVTVTAGKFTMPASNVTVTAQWVTCTPESYELWASSGRIAEFKPTDKANEYDLTFKLTDAIMNNLYVKDNCGNTYGYNGAINPGKSITLVKGLESFKFETAAQNETWHYVFNSNTLVLSCDAQSEEKKKDVNVTYEANGGYFNELGNPITKVVVEKYGTPYSKSVTPIRDGYTFTGWYDAASGGSVITNVTTATAHSVYAHWEQIYLYVVGRFNIYDEEHDTWIKTTTSGSGWDLNSKNIPFTFNESTKKYELQTNAKPYDLSVNMNGYPQYFMVREGSASAANGVFYYEATGCQFNDSKTSTTLTKGSTSDPGSTYHEKMRFNYESDKANLVTLIFDPSNNQLSYTKTAIPTPTVTFDVNGGDALDPNTKNVTYRDTYGELPTPSKDGYHFDGWFTALDGGTQVTSETKVTNSSDHTLYAHWTQIHVYIVGRFKVRSSEGGAWIYTGSREDVWAMNSTNIEMPLSGSNYVLNTYASVSELSSINNNDAPGWFAITEKVGSTTTTYLGNGEGLKADNKSATLSTSNEKHVKFNDKTDNSQPVILTYNPTTHTISYTAVAQSYTLNFSASSNGTLTAIANEVEVTTGSSVEQGSAIVFTATPEDGYYLSGLTKNTVAQEIPGRNPDGTYTINATMGGADETWAATFAAITATPHVNSDAAIVQTGATATVRLTYTPVAPKGELTFCYSLYKNNAGAWDKVEDIEFTAATLPTVQFTAPMEEGTYRVGVVMHQGATCEGAAVGEEQYSSEFRIANVYTVTYGQYPSAKATLTAEVDGESIGDSPAEVSAGSDIVFTVSGIASKYAVQGWYADAECTRPIYDGVAANLKSYTLSNLSADAEVYVKFFAPTVVNGIDLKDETNTSTMSFAVGEKITAIPQFEYKGLGDKAYCWEVLDATTNMHVNATIKSIGDKKITIYINEPGSYKLNLTIHDADCNGDQNSTYTTGEFTVAEREYYIVGNAFWGINDVNDLSTSANVSFKPTLESGQYYWGPWQFTKNDETHNYLSFLIYDKGKQKFYHGNEGGDDWLLQLNAEAPMLVVSNPASTKYYTTVDNGGNWKFSSKDYYLYIKNGKLTITDDAPDLSPKVRLAITYTDAAGVVHNLYSNEVSLPEESENSAIISFFVPQGTGFSNISYHMEQQKAGEGWVTDGIALAANPSATESGVYYTTFTQTTDAETTITLGELTKYVGDYYVRSAAFNSMDNYLENNECKMIFTDRSNGDRFDYFACKWCADANQDVRYCIANIYNPNLSGVLVADEYITAAGKLDNKAANVRFAWKSATNYMFRAYLEGSSTEDYLKIMPDPAAAENHKIYTTAGGSTVLSNTKFTDLQDWTYTIAEVYAQLGAKVTVRAKYKDKYQYFYGAGDIETGAITGYDYLIGNAESPEESTRYKMRIVYDFKVDRLVCGWIPTEDTPIDGHKVIDCDILIIREHNEDANVIRFSDAGQEIPPFDIENVKTVYGVMQFNKSVMTNTASYANYAVNQMYWVSFPFDVRVGAIFGISGYGTNWRMMKYNGERRSKEGYFVETTTFWEAMTEDEVMKANTGYLLNLSFPYFANPNSTVWAHGVLSVSLYFPSSESVKIISTKTRDVEVPEHECTIDRTFTKDEVEYNHKETDSNWNIIGIPSFEPLAGNEKLTNENFYVWEVKDGAQTYTPQKGTDPDFNFKPTMAYMVQFGGTLNWKAGSTPVIPSPFAAPARAQENTNYTLDLRLLNSEEKMLDRTYVKLEDEASDEFELNEDMLKIDNPKYNFFARTADGYATGASSISFKDQTIELGGSVAKEQEYTIRLNRSVNCDVRLIDREEGTTTNLNIMDYTTTIPAGSLGKRFALRIQTSQEVVTGFENTVTDKDDIKKFMIDGILYIQHNGTVYDAMGRRQY